jgi:hypothetical protein
MKQIFTLIACMFSASLISNAQFTENFDGSTMAPCWEMTDATVTNTGSNFYLSLDKKQATTVSTPYLQPTSNNITVSFTYWFSEIKNNTNRTMTVSVGNETKTLLLPITTNHKDTTLNFTVPNTSTWQKVTFVLTGDGANNIGIGFDNLIIDGVSSTKTSCENPSPITLPIKLVNFDAKYNQPNVDLNWSTAQEVNFNRFVIETSADGANFNEAGIVFGNGESDSPKNYSFQDKNIKASKGFIYYRLRSVDNDGRFSYSAVRIIRIGASASSMSLTTYPNPVVTDVKVTLPSNWQGKTIKLEIYNANGQKMQELVSTNASQTEIMNLSKMNKGLYIVKASCENEIAMQKLIKN